MAQLSGRSALRSVIQAKRGVTDSTITRFSVCEKRYFHDYKRLENEENLCHKRKHSIDSLKIINTRLLGQFCRQLAICVMDGFLTGCWVTRRGADLSGAMDREISRSHVTS